MIDLDLQKFAHNPSEVFPWTTTNVLSLPCCCGMFWFRVSPVLSPNFESCMAKLTIVITLKKMKRPRRPKAATANDLYWMPKSAYEGMF
jgi:hypothetical protein